MGIEIPPPQGGPAVFTTMSPAHDPCSMTLSPDGDRLKSPDPAEDFNDAESTSFSEGKAKDTTGSTPSLCGKINKKYFSEERLPSHRRDHRLTTQRRRRHNNRRVKHCGSDQYCGT